MRLRLFLLVPLVSLLLAPAAFAQKKPKDPVLQAYLEETFADLSSKLLKLADRLSVIEEELAKIKQQQSQAAEELRTSQTLLKTNDAALSSFRLSTQQDLLSLKQDLGRIQQELAALLERVQKPEPAPPAEGPRIEGYITAVLNNDVTINLGSAVGMKVGSRLAVFRATDPKLQIGVIEVTEVLDANNSRAKVVFNKPGIKFEFSDIVRPE